MAGPSTALSPVIAASTHWLVRAYPSSGADRAADALAELQARQAVTVAAWLRYPTPVDAELVAMAGAGGSAGPGWGGRGPTPRCRGPASGRVGPRGGERAGAAA